MFRLLTRLSNSKSIRIKFSQSNAIKRANLVKRSLSSKIRDIESNEATLSIEPQKDYDQDSKKTKSRKFKEFSYFSLMESYNIDDILELIEPYLSIVDEHALGAIYHKLVVLYFEFQKGKPQELDQFRRLNQQNAKFSKLIERTNEIVNDLTIGCLLNALKLFSLVNLDLKSDVLQSFSTALQQKTKEMSLNEINDCMVSLFFYAKNKKSNTAFSDLHEHLIDAAYSKIIRGQFEDLQVDKLIRCINALAKNSKFKNNKIASKNQESITLLLEHLMTKDLNFYHAVSLYGFMKKISYVYTENDLSLLPDIYAKTINKLNDIIYDTIVNEPSLDNFNRLLNFTHNTIDSTQFNATLFYDSKMLNAISPYLAKNFRRLNKIYVYFLICNYSRFNLYDDQLLKSFYFSLLKDHKLINVVDPFTCFHLLTRYRFPFVDKNKLSKLLFNKSSQVLKSSLKFKTNRIRLLSDLILNEINDKELIRDVLKLTDSIDKNIFSTSSMTLFKNVCLSKALVEQGLIKFDPDLAYELFDRFDKIADYISINTYTPYIDKRYFNANGHKVQNHCYLSNQILAFLFGIYDKSIDDLISLTEYEAYFKKIDKIPLDEDQELIVFLPSMRIRCGGLDYEAHYNYQLKRILNLMNVRTIEVRFIFFKILISIMIIKLYLYL